MSALYRWPCSISIHLSPRSVIAGLPCSAGHVAFLCICLPGLSLLVSALFRWPCSFSSHLSPRSVTAGARSFPLAMQHFYSFVSQVCHCWCPPFSAGHVAFLFICLPGLSLSFLCICLPGLSLLVSALLPPLSPSRLLATPSHLSPSCSALQSFTFVSQLWAAVSASALQSFNFTFVSQL